MNDENMKKISIAMTTYNGAIFIATQLESIINQTVAPFEVIVVDDCSTDDTWYLLEQYAKKYPIIHIFKNEKNLGPTKNFEKAVNLCSGDYIALSDQDDIWFENKLEMMLDNIGDAMLIHHDAKLIDDNGQVIGDSLLKFIDYYHIADFFTRLMREGVHGCCLMMKKEVANAARYIPDGFVYHDFFYNLTACALGKVKTIYQPLMSYRLHHNNACGLFAEKSYDRAMKDYAKNLKNMKLIVNLPVFEKYKNDIEFYINYYSKFVNHNLSMPSFILLVKKKLGCKKAFALLINNVFGVRGVKFLYNIINNKRVSTS